MTDRTRRRRAGWFVVALGLASLIGPGEAPGQVLGLPGATKAAPAPAAKDDPSAKPVANKGKPGEVFSATAAPIKVDEQVDNPAIEKLLDDLLPQFPGVRAVDVRAKEGIVTLAGQVDDDETLDDVTAFAQKVEGVRLVLNKMETDAEVLTGPQKAVKVLRHYRHVVAENWLLAIIATLFVAAFTYMARLFNEYSETILSPFFRNALLRAVVGSVLSSLLIVAGIMIGLSVLNLTQAVLSILGLAGVAGLAVGFAFRDIVENFIASMLLGLRRPFGIGDFITVAGRSGSVLSLDTRATTLITPEGAHVRIPNAVIYKETLVNASITPSLLGSVEVVVPYESSIATVLEAMCDALRATDGLLTEPSPRTLVQALETGGVRLRATYWMPARGLDLDKLQSDLRLKIKVNVQRATLPPAPPVVGANPGAAGLPDQGAPAAPMAPAPATAPPAPPAVAPTAAVAEENLRKDSEAADQARTDHAEHEATPIDHAIRQAEAAAATKDGGNLLAGATNGKV